MNVDLWKPVLENEIIFDHTPLRPFRFNFFVQNQDFFSCKFDFKKWWKIKMESKI